MEEARRALKNYDWLMRNRADTELHWESDTLIWGNGGVDISIVTDPGLTLATADDTTLSEAPALPVVEPGHSSAQQIVAEAMWDSDLRSERGRTVCPRRDQGIAGAQRAAQSCPVQRGPVQTTRPDARFANEAELAEKVLAILQPHFEIETEVSGRHCSGRRLRIDAVLRPRDPSAWKDDNPAFGVESKLANQGGCAGPTGDNAEVMMVTGLASAEVITTECSWTIAMSYIHGYKNNVGRTLEGRVA